MSSNWQVRRLTSLHLSNIDILLYGTPFRIPCKQWFPTGGQSSNYQHRQASALLHSIQNIRIRMGKKPIVSVTYQNGRISIENSLPYFKCVLRLSCVVHRPIYGSFMAFYVNAFLSNTNPYILNVMQQCRC